MSLLKQLLISVSLAIVLILAGIVWLSMDSARAYLNTQLQAQTDSAATSLALTLSQPTNQDPVIQELIIMAQFDSGQFSQISLSDVEGVPLFQRQVTTTQNGVAPEWFSRIFPVVIAESAAQVSDGWRQIGQLYLQADATYARDTLWRSFVGMVAWVVGAGALWAIFVLFLIRWLRRVLHKEVAQQLQNLSTREPLSNHKKKATFSELNEVTAAIASARQNILLTTEEQNAKIEQLEIELNQDPVTGLVNRKYFINELRLRLEQHPPGWLFIFRQRDLAEINRVMTRAHVDEWLRSLSQQLQQLIQAYQPASQVIVARLNGSDFVMLADLKEEALSALIAGVQKTLYQQRIQLPNGDFCRWAMAQTDYLPGQSLNHVLGRLDQALMRAESAGHQAIEVLTSEQVDSQIDQFKGGETQWRTLIQEALLQNGFGLEVNPIRLQGKQWHEATLLLQPTHEPAQTLSGYQFMPVATRLGLSGACDLRAMELALSWLDTHPDQRLIMRVSLSSITQTDFSEQAKKRLVAATLATKKRLAVELDVYAFKSEPVRVADFAQVLYEHHVDLGVRRLLSLPRVLLDLQTFHVDYARVFAADIDELSVKIGGEVLLRSLLDISAQIDLTVVVDGNQQKLLPSTQRLLQEYGINS